MHRISALVAFVGLATACTPDSPCDDGEVFARGVCVAVAADAGSDAVDAGADATPALAAEELGAEPPAPAPLRR